MLRFGIDRAKLKDIPIEQVNIKKLKEKGFLVIQDKKDDYRILKDEETGQNIGINYIKVSKQQDETLRINELKVGRGKIPDLNILPTVDYEHLDINLPSQISDKGINDQNINNTNDLVEALRRVEKELQGLGFGKVSLIDTAVKEMEINCNIPLQKPFKDYERAVEYLFNLLPKTLKNFNKHKTQGVFTGVTIKNTQQEIKMYDKQRQIKDKTGIETARVIRLEYTFKTEQKIQNTFNGKTLKEISKNNFKSLQEAMRGLVYNDLIKRANKDINKQIRHATRELAKYKGRGGATAGQEYVYDYEVFDIEIMLAGLKAIDKAGNFTRDARKEIKRALEGKQIKLFGNINKINEILRSLGMKEIEIKLTPTIKKKLKKHY